MTYADLLKDTCTIRRYTTDGTLDDDGHPVETMADHLVDEPCRKEETVTGAGREIYIGAQVVIAEYILFLGAIDVTERDQIIIGDVTYEILLVQIYGDSDSTHHTKLSIRTVR